MAEVAVPRGIDGRARQSEPLGALLAVLGAVADPQLKAVYARGGLLNFASVMDSPFVQIPHDVVVPGILETGDVESARDELLRVAPATPLEPAESGLTDQELDDAFARAEPETDQMLDADGVAQAAIAEADRALAGEAEQPLAHEVGEQFATATMAGLLEQQGDAGGASQIRASLDAGVAPLSTEEPTASPRSGRDRVIHTLEQWLENLRGGARA